MNVHVLYSLTCIIIKTTTNYNDPSSRQQLITMILAPIPRELLSTFEVQQTRYFATIKTSYLIWEKVNRCFKNTSLRNIFRSF